MLPDLEYAALRFETFADEVLRPLATPITEPLEITVAQFEDESVETVRDENWKAHRQTQRSL